MACFLLATEVPYYPDDPFNCWFRLNSYIVKPVEFEKFTQVVEQLGYSWLLTNQPPPAPRKSPISS